MNIKNTVKRTTKTITVTHKKKKKKNLENRHSFLSPNTKYWDVDAVVYAETTTARAFPPLEGRGTGTWVFVEEGRGTGTWVFVKEGKGDGYLGLC